MKFPLRTALAVAALCCAASVAHAETVSVPFGDWISSALDALQKLFVAAAAGGVSFAAIHLGPVAGNFLRQYLTHQVVEQAVNYAIGAVKGATHGQVLSADVTSNVVAEAAKYVVANAPRLAKKFDATLEPKIFARLSAMGLIHPDTTARQAGAEVSVKLSHK